MATAVLADCLRAIFLIPAALTCGRLCKDYLRLPLITGYFFCGILCGPHCLQTSVTRLRPVEEVCLALIGISAGSELQLMDMRKNYRQILALTVCITVATWSFIFIATSILLDGSELIEIVGRNKMPVISSLAATVMVARSPASAIAVVRELEARGPFSSLALAVIIVKDILVIALFSVNLSFAERALHKEDSHFLVNTAETIFNIQVAVAIGVVCAYIQCKVFENNSKKNISYKIVQCSSLFLISAAIYSLSGFLETEPLLACLVVGTMVINKSPDKNKRILEDFKYLLHNLMPIVHVVFFGLAGASVHVDTLPSFIWTALFLYSVRLLSLYVGTWIGSKGSHAFVEYSNVTWMAYVTQAGVAMGLAKSVQLKFPEWGGTFYTLMVSVILLNQATGPTMFKASLQALGEVHHSHPPHQNV